MNLIYRYFRFVFIRIIWPVKYLIFIFLWRRKNKNNRTLPKYMNPAIWFVDLKKVKIWKSTYWTLEIHSFWDEWEWLEIGNYCSIADGVKFILWGNHNYNNLTTFPIWIHYGIKWAKKKRILLIEKLLYEMMFGFELMQKLCLE